MTNSLTRGDVVEFMTEDGEIQTGQVMYCHKDHPRTNIHVIGSGIWAVPNDRVLGKVVTERTTKECPHATQD